MLTHHNLRRVVDVFGSVDGRDLGAVAGDIERIVDEGRKSLPRGSQIVVRGQIETMPTSLTGCWAAWRSRSCSCTC